MTHVNGEMAALEMSVRAKKVNLPLKMLRLPDDDRSRQDNRGDVNAPRRPAYNAMQLQQDQFGGEGGNTVMYGGHTNYDNDRMIRELATPNQGYMDPMQPSGGLANNEDTQWGGNQ